MPRPLLAAIGLLVLAATAGASDDPRAKALYGEVIAPCCWSQPVSAHQSPAAEEVRRTIARHVAEGWADQQIKDALVGQYGVRVLARPPARGFTWTLYLMPWLVLLGSGIGLSVLVRRFLGAPRGSASADAPTARTAPTELSDRLDEELRDLD